MAIFKKIMKNLFILIGVLLGLAFICLGIMYFANVSIFGIQFKKAGISKTTYHEFDIDYSKVDEIVVSVGNTKLDVVANEKENFFELHFEDDCWGLVKKGNDVLNFTTNVSADGSVVTINVNEPKGWLMWRNTKATLKLPKAVIDNVDVKYSIASAKGEVIFDAINEAESEAEIGEINFTSTKKSNLTINDKVVDLTATTAKGKIKASQAIHTINFDTKKGDLQFDKVHNLSVGADNTYIKGNLVTGAFTFESQYGKIVIDEIGTKSLAVKDEHIKDALDNGYSQDYILTYAECAITTSGADIEIGSLVAKTKITTTSGDVEIENLLTEEIYNNTIETKSGSIEIDNIYAKQLELKSKKGKIEASVCGDDADAILKINNVSGKIIVDSDASYVSHVKREKNQSQYNYTVIESYLGAVETYNEKGTSIFEDVNFILKANSNKGRITAEFKNICTGSSLNSEKGRILVKVATNNSSIIYAQSQKGKVDVELPTEALDKVDKSHNKLTFNIAGGSAERVLNISTVKSKIQIRELA